MLDTAIFSRIRTAAGRFSGANQGNIAVLFAIAAVPVLTFVGAAIDYTRANSARTAMQGALDSTALMLAKDLGDNTITTSQITQKAQDYFLALYTNTDAKQVGVTASYTQNTGAGSNIVLSGSGNVNTDFLRIAGFPSINFNTSSTSTWGNTRMRVAMVLDNTGSMASNGKMPALQKAASDMIDTLSGFNKTAGDVYISIVPFSKDVNVGTANVGASWINWTNWEAEPPFLVGNKSNSFKNAVGGSNCPFTSANQGFTCMDRPATMSGATGVSKIPSTGTYAGYICPSVDGGQKPASGAEGIQGRGRALQRSRGRDRQIVGRCRAGGGVAVAGRAEQPAGSGGGRWCGQDGCSIYGGFQKRDGRRQDGDGSRRLGCKQSRSSTGTG